MLKAQALEELIYKNPLSYNTHKNYWELKREPLLRTCDWIVKENDQQAQEHENHFPD